MCILDIFFAPETSKPILIPLEIVNKRISVCSQCLISVLACGFIRFVSPRLCSVSLGSVSACECSGLSLSVRAVVYDTCRSDEKYKG